MVSVSVLTVAIEEVRRFVPSTALSSWPLVDSFELTNDARTRKIRAGSDFGVIRTSTRTYDTKNIFPTLVSSVEKKFFVTYVRTYVLVLVLITPKSLPSLILRVLASFVNSKTIHQLLSEKAPTAVPPRWQQQGRRPLVDLPIQ